MDERNETLVLRSVNLPMSMDEALRGLAYRLRCSKSDLIRHFVGQGLVAMQQRVGDEGRIEETLQQRILKELAGEVPAPSRVQGPGATRAVAAARARALSSRA